MKKVYIIVGIIVVVAAALAAAVLFKKDSSAPANLAANNTTLKMYDACQLLTKEKASEALGTSDTLFDEATPASSDDLKVTNCTYNNNAGNARDIVSASVLVRSPLTQNGVDSNTETFSNASIVGEMAVSGYGEKAFWNSSTGQLNVLKDSNWIIVSYGKAQPSTHMLEDTKMLADKLFR